MDCKSWNRTSYLSWIWKKTDEKHHGVFWGMTISLVKLQESECATWVATLYLCSWVVTLWYSTGKAWTDLKPFKTQSCWIHYKSECRLSSEKLKGECTKRIVVKPVTLPGLVISFVMFHLRSKTLVLVGCWPAVAGEGQRSLYDHLPLLSEAR